MRKSSPSCHFAPKLPVFCASQMSRCPRVSGKIRSAKVAHTRKVLPTALLLPVRTITSSPRSAFGFPQPLARRLEHQQRRPQAVCLLEQDETYVIGVRLTGSPDHQVERSKPHTNLYGRPQGRCAFRKSLMRLTQDFHRSVSTPIVYSQRQYAQPSSTDPRDL